MLSIIYYYTVAIISIGVDGLFVHENQACNSAQFEKMRGDDEFVAAECPRTGRVSA